MIKRGAKQLSLFSVGLFAFPFGVAIQNAVATVLSLWALIRLRGQALASCSFPTTWVGGAFLCWMAVSTILAPETGWREAMRFLVGHSFWWLAPLVLGSVARADSHRPFERLSIVLSWTLAIWALVACSQAIWGWFVAGNQIVLGDGFRPRGFYSHPLSLAYACFLLWPLCLVRVVHFPWQKRWWISLLSVAILIVLTHSRTVQAVAGVSILANLFLHLKGRRRLVAIVAAFLTLSTVVTAYPPIRQKFFRTFSSEGLDRSGPFQFDRIAFWLAHWEMVKERPLLGHGVGRHEPERKPYYEKIGLRDFTKPYPAHNVLLQLWADGGLVGLLLFLSWIGLVLQELRFIRSPWLRSACLQTILWFLLASMTQNSFQDASVRMGIALLHALFWAHRAYSVIE